MFHSSSLVRIIRTFGINLANDRPKSTTVINWCRLCFFGVVGVCVFIVCFHMFVFAVCFARVGDHLLFLKKIFSILKEFYDFEVCSLCS